MANVVFGLTENYMLEPKRNNLFTLRFHNGIPNGTAGAKDFMQIDLVSASRPTYTHNVLEIQRFNMRYKVAQVPTMGHTMAVTFRDTIQLNLGKEMYLWNKVMFNRENGTMGYASAYKTNAYLDIFDPRGDVIERWYLKGVFPSETNWGDLTYDGNGDPLTVAVTLAYDVAWLEEDTSKVTVVKSDFKTPSADGQNAPPTTWGAEEHDVNVGTKISDAQKKVNDGTLTGS